MPLIIKLYLWWLIACFFVCLFLAVILIEDVNSLKKYLHDKNYGSDLKRLIGGGSLVDPFLLHSYIFNQSSEADQDLRELKNTIKKWYRYFYISFFIFASSLVIGIVIVFTASVLK